MTARITARVLAAALVAAVALVRPAVAQDLKVLNAAVEKYNAGSYAEASVAFFDVAENAGEPELAYRAEYFLALSLYKMGLHHSALTYDSFIVEQGPNHPYYQKAVENMLDVMDAVGDKALIPQMLDKEYNDAFAKLPSNVINRINFLVALWSDQQNKLEDAEAFLDAVPKDSASYPRARYLRGVQYARAATAAGGDDKLNQQASQAFEEVLSLEKTEKAPYADLQELKELSTLALARVRYAQGKFEQSFDLYSQVPRFSRHWRDALFEGAYAAFQNDESGKALGLLHTLHAPMAGDQLVPESWLLKSYIYFFACLFDETKAALAHLQKVYPQVGAQVKALLEAKREPEFYYVLLQKGEQGGTALPAMVRNELLADEKLRTRRSYIAALEDEMARVKGLEEWKKSALRPFLLESVEQQRNILIQVAGKGVYRALQQIDLTLDDIDGRAEIVKFEMAKKEKDLLEAAFDNEAQLGRQSLYRPAMPVKGVEYWDFEGEYWPDELGYYRYTVKNACPAPTAAEEEASAQ